MSPAIHAADGPTTCFADFRLRIAWIALRQLLNEHLGRGRVLVSVGLPHGVTPQDYLYGVFGDHYASPTVTDPVLRGPSMCLTFKHKVHAEEVFRVIAAFDERDWKAMTIPTSELPRFPHEPL